MDYRPALRSRSGVGEYAHGLAVALSAAFRPESSSQPLQLTIFSSSWRDRLQLDPDLRRVDAIDLRVPVSGLNLAWHRLGWPTVERLTGRSFDVTHSLHPLLMPARSAACVVTIHDLNFLSHPERTRAEIRRDYPALARQHANTADHIIVVSEFTAGEVVSRLGVPRDCITVCSPGAPDWTPRPGGAPNGYVLFLGTLEPRKNVGTLLDAWERLVSRATGPLPELVLAGQTTPDATPWLERVSRAPLAGHVRHIGYVTPQSRQNVYAGARLLVQPSFEEGFGIPVLEAMTLGVPVVAANRGALPEVLGHAGLLFDAQDPEALASAISRVLDDPGLATQCAERGHIQARRFQWPHTARHVYEAYGKAIEHRRARLGQAGCASA